MYKYNSSQTKLAPVNFTNNHIVNSKTFTKFFFNLHFSNYPYTTKRVAEYNTKCGIQFRAESIIKLPCLSFILIRPDA